MNSNRHGGSSQDANDWFHKVDSYIRTEGWSPASSYRDWFHKIDSWIRTEGWSPASGDPNWFHKIDSWTRTDSFPSEYSLSSFSIEGYEPIEISLNKMEDSCIKAIPNLDRPECSNSRLISAVPNIKIDSSIEADPRLDPIEYFKYRSPRKATKFISAGAAKAQHTTRMLFREQLLHLFDRFTFLVSQPDVKKRIADCVRDKQEVVAVTTEIQKEIFLDMGVDPQIGMSSLGKIITDYENDRDLLIQFYNFVRKEEIAWDEADIGEDELAEKLQNQQKLEEQQLEMLIQMRKFHLDDQSVILEKLHQQMEYGNYESKTSILSAEQMEKIIQKKVSPC